MILTFDLKVKLLRFSKGRRGRNLILVWFTTTYASSAFKSCSWWSVLDTTLCDKVCQWLATGWWFSPGTLDSSINKTDHHDITEILLKVVLNIITPLRISIVSEWLLFHTNSAIFQLHHGENKLTFKDKGNTIVLI